MELRPAFFLFLLLSLHCFSAGRSWREVGDSESEETYEIDYRGPETHSFIPPPHHSHSSPSIKGEGNPKMKKLHK